MTPSSPFAHGLHRQQGATLIVVVLLTMLMLLAVLFVTMNLSMSTRRTTTDQKMTIPAQFAAESGMAAAQAQLRTFRELVPLASTQTTLTDEVLTLKKNDIPSVSPAHLRGVAMRFDNVMSQLQQLCGNVTPQNLDTVNVAVGTRTYRNVLVNNVATVCEFPTNTKVLSGNQLNVFRTLFLTVNSNTSAKPIVDKLDANGLSSAADREKFLSAIFSNTVETNISGQAKARVTSGIRPVALVRGAPTGGDPRTSVSQTSYPYYLLFQLSDIESIGENNTSTRRQIMSNTNDMYAMEMRFGFFGIKQDKPKTIASFTNFAMFVNNAADGAPLGRDTYVQGRMHTNTYWKTRVFDNGAGFRVDGKITSAGCERLAADDFNCAVAKNALIMNADNGRRVYAPSKVGRDATYDYVGRNGRDNAMIRVKSGQEYNFQDDPIPLPSNASNQMTAAKDGGIYIPSNVAQLDLSVTRINNVDMQNFVYTSGRSTCRLRVVPEISGEERIERILFFNGQSWEYARRSTSTSCGFSGGGDGTTTFNGNFYVDGVINRLTKNQTRSGDRSYAIADSMKMTLTATGNIRVATSIDYRNRVDSDSALGLYSSGTIDEDRDGKPDGGSVTFTNDATTNMKLDAFIMAPKGAFYLEGLDGSTNNKGSLSQYGGQIIKGGGSGMGISTTNGYTAREYLYDAREVVPRGFPTYEEKEVPADIVADGNPYLIYINTGFYNSGNLTLPSDSFENNGEIRQVGVQ